jgi:hypothetical protein
MIAPAVAATQNQPNNNAPADQLALVLLKIVARLIVSVPAAKSKAVVAARNPPARKVAIVNAPSSNVLRIIVARRQAIVRIVVVALKINAVRRSLASAGTAVLARRRRALAEEDATVPRMEKDVPVQKRSRYNATKKYQ